MTGRYGAIDAHQQPGLYGGMPQPPGYAGFPDHREALPPAGDHGRVPLPADLSLEFLQDVYAQFAKSDKK